MTDTLDSTLTLRLREVLANSVNIGAVHVIEKGASSYVCGDGGKMEPDVKAALVSIYRERSGANADAGQRWIDDLGTKNRYVLDVWASG